MNTPTPHVQPLPGLRIANVYLVVAPGVAPWLVDTGHRLERQRLLAGLRRLGVAPEELGGVVLTHRHSDHAGNARFLQRVHGVRIAAHHLDAAILAGDAPRPRLSRRGGSALAGVFAWLENRWPAEPLHVDLALEDGQHVAGLRVYHVGGHTPGSIFLLHEDSGALLSGDLMMTASPPLVRREGFSLPYESFTDDMGQALDSIAAFHACGVPYEHLLPGHGPPWLGRARHRVVVELERQLPPPTRDHQRDR